MKVFRTPIGFHDAYVAAPSQKAALAAWGAEANIFAQGIAEQVEEDSAAAKEALANPGAVVRTLRGSADEHVRALGKVGGKKARKAGVDDRPSPRPSPASGRGRKPSRERLAAAEAALAERERRHRDRLRQLDEEAEELRRRRREAERDYQRERQALKEALRDEQRRYERAMDAWRG